MDLPREVDEYIRESIDHSLGLPISMGTLQQKLRSSEESHRRLRDQYLPLVSRLKEKDQVIDSARAEASINAQALKKFVEENQKLAAECANLLNQCKKWERECLLYHQDREALMDFGNEADERAKEAETRVRELEEEMGRISEELQVYKHRYENREVDASNAAPLEEKLLDSVLATLVSKDEAIAGRVFLEANNQDQSCQTLLNMWNHLRPSTQRVLSLITRTKKLEKEKECLILNLDKAEQEVELVSKQNQRLDKENRKLLRQHYRECSPHCSAEKNYGSASAKSNKRKSSPKMMNSPVEKKIEFSSPETARQPLSPVWCNSPDSRASKK